MTRIIAEGAASVSATEISNTMMRRLADKGYRWVVVEFWLGLGPRQVPVRVRIAEE